MSMRPIVNSAMNRQIRAGHLADTRPSVADTLQAQLEEFKVGQAGKGASRRQT